MIELKYEPAIMPAIKESIGSDFWHYGPVGKPLISMITGPVKFSESVSIFIRQGTCRFTLSLKTWDIKGPATVYVRSGEILQVEEVSDDTVAYCVLYSPTLTENLFSIITQICQQAPMQRCPVYCIPEDCLDDFDVFYRRIGRLAADKENPHRLDAILFATASFFFQICHRLTPMLKEEQISVANRTVEIFLRMARQHFREQRFLDFYAAKMKITPKHLSRTIKLQTGITAAEWLDRFVILEAKVLLRSSNLNIQEISDYLHFPSQSFFSKYFKKAVGESPSDYRYHTE